MTTQTQEIKAGDRVVCVDDSASFRRLRAGDVYAVVENFDGSLTVMVGGASHSLERFRRVEEIDSGNLEGACVTAPAPAGWEGVEAGSGEVIDLPRAIEAATPWVISRPLPRLDAAVAAQVDAAPGPGSVRPFEHPRLPEVQMFVGMKTGITYTRVRTSDLTWERVVVDESVGPFPVEPPPGLSAAQRRLVGGGWEVEALWVAGWAYMLSPGGVHMWVESSGRQHIGQPSEVTYPNGSRVFFDDDDDGAAARVARERNGDKLELPDGRVQGVDRG